MLDAFVISIEATGFDQTVYDVENLSAIRGASLAMLYAPDKAEPALRRSRFSLEKIYSGASEGAFWFAAEQVRAEELKELAADIRTAIHKSDLPDKGPYEHLGHAVSIVKVIGGDKSGALLRARALNAVQKRQSITWPLPDYDPDSKGFDEGGDRVRPAVIEYKYKKTEKWVSSAFKARHVFGNRERSKFYEKILFVKGFEPVVEDFEEMVAAPLGSLGASLKTKTAVFFADGNKLGTLAASAIANGTITNYSRELKRHQENLLTAINDWRAAGYLSHKTRHAVLNTDKSKEEWRWRFESLLWGGDEVCFVMPAWHAIEFVKLFFAATKGWTVTGTPVTQSAGLVICPHKTPIRQIKKIAEDLAKECKKNFTERSLLQIEIFESIALPDTGLDRYRKRLYGEAATHVSKQITIDGDKLDGFVGTIVDLKKRFPRSQLYKLLRSGAKGDAGPARFIKSSDVENPHDKALRAEYATWLKRAGSESKLDEKSLDILEPPDRTASVTLMVNLGMLAMLWDYVQPFDDAEPQP